MTDKRFTETLSTGIVTDHITGKEYNCEMRIDDKLLELLNELHDECEFLKIDNEALEHGATIYAELYHKSLKEIEQLEKEVEEYNEDAMSYQTLYEQQLKKFEELLSECKHQQEQKMKFHKANEQLKEENNKLHQKIFEMRTNISLERTEISRQTYTGKKNEKEYLDAKEFLDEIEKW